MESVRELPEGMAPPVAAGAGEGVGAKGQDSNISWPALWIGMISLSAVVATICLLAPPPKVSTIQPTGMYVFGLTGMICVVAALMDAATQRVPNALTYPAILCGLLLNCVPVAAKVMGFGEVERWLGAGGPNQSLMGLVMCGGIGFLSLLVAGMGGGDMKLLAAVGALLGFGQAGLALIAALVVAVVYSLVNLALRGRLNPAVRAGAVRLVEIFFLKQWIADQPVPVHGRGLRERIPLAVPLAIGLVASRFVPLDWLTFGLMSA